MPYERAVPGSSWHTKAKNAELKKRNWEKRIDPHYNEKMNGTHHHQHPGQQLPPMAAAIARRRRNWSRPCRTRSSRPRTRQLGNQKEFLSRFFALVFSKTAAQRSALP
jgi:hypothetical protein